jgi:hypothetical protein
MADNSMKPPKAGAAVPPRQRKLPIRDVLEFVRLLLAIECLQPSDNVGRDIAEMCVREALALGWVLAEHEGSPVMDDTYDEQAAYHLTTLGIAAARWGGAEVVDGGLTLLEDG